MPRRITPPGIEIIFGTVIIVYASLGFVIIIDVIVIIIFTLIGIFIIFKLFLIPLQAIFPALIDGNKTAVRIRLPHVRLGDNRIAAAEEYNRRSHYNRYLQNFRCS